MLDIVLVDDHKLVRDGIKGILERGSEFRVVGEAESGADAVNLCKKTQPHIALMDIGLPGMNGIEATTELLRHCPTVKVIILSMYDDENSVVSAIRSGARAFVLKKASSTELLDALRTVARGGSYLSSQVSDRLLARIQRGDLDTHDRSPLESLSPRERRQQRGWADAARARRRFGSLEHQRRQPRRLKSAVGQTIGFCRLPCRLLGWPPTREIPCKLGNAGGLAAGDLPLIPAASRRSFDPVKAPRFGEA
jgi:DNA-binding NarL/FixJ family response regulator